MGLFVYCETVFVKTRHESIPPNSCTCYSSYIINLKAIKIAIHNRIAIGNAYFNPLKIIVGTSRLSLPKTVVQHR